MRRFEWLILLVIIVYSAGVALPTRTLWFDPGTPTFKNAVEGQPIELEYSRSILRDSLIRYAVVIRHARTNELVCEVQGGPFTYKKSEGPLVGKTLAWWVSDEPGCSHMGPGDYWAETTWTVVRPLGDLLPQWLSMFGWVLPEKYVTRQSPLFTISRAGATPSEDES